MLVQADDAVLNRLRNQVADLMVAHPAFRALKAHHGHREPPAGHPSSVARETQFAEAFGPGTPAAAAPDADQALNTQMRIWLLAPRIKFPLMSAPLTSVQWLVRAEDARLDAAAMNDPQGKRMMLVMAASYERLAAHAMCLERSGLPHEGARTDFQLRGSEAHPAVGSARRVASLFDYPRHRLRGVRALAIASAEGKSYTIANSVTA